MNVACFAVALLATTFLLHVVVWRIRLPRSQSGALLALFMACLLLGSIGNALAPQQWPFRISGFFEYAHVCLFHVAFMLAYVEFYTVIEEDSPTVSILLFVNDSGGEGRTEEEIFGLIDDSFVIGGRLEAMVSAGIVELHGARYRLTSSGLVCARVLQFVRGCYRLRVGG